MRCWLTAQHQRRQNWIEVLIVVAALAILAAVGGPQAAY
jgi:Tfp pilus assembly major pilin PilA